jgi:hypothetical protein
MIEESDRKKNRKHDADSSAEMIDSFFGSQNFNDEKTNHENTANFKETEEMIDKILEKKDTPKDSNESFHPTVEVFEENTPNTTNEKSFPSDKHTMDYPSPKSPTIHEKEEIFEIDKPKQNKKQPRGQESKNHKSKKTEKKENRKKTHHKKQKDTGKIKFSLHLPKLNIKFGKKNKQPKKSFDKKTKKETREQKEELQSQRQKPNTHTTKGSGRIHGISKVTTKEECEPQKKVSKNKDEKEKKGLFTSSEKSFSLFKRKTNKKQKKPSKAKSTNPSTSDTKKDPITNQIHTSPAETTIPTETIDEDVIHLLKITDELLGKLPEEVIEEFSQSDDFALYEKVMKKYDIVK